ncbi:MAG: glycosyltransferase [Rhodobacteraceae bacterium]|nr:glycosyltransferase [Paracoccaceae bacterium]
MTVHLPDRLQPADPGAHAGARRVVAIVVTHDRLAQLRMTLRRLLAAPGHVLAGVVVVDNASGDGTGVWLRGLSHPRLHALRLAQNAGGAGGFAAGLAHARRVFDPDWYLLMDDDARPMPGTLAAFHASALTGWDAVAGAAWLPAGGICDTNRPSHDPFGSWRMLWRTLRRGREGFHLGAAAYARRGPVRVDAASYVGLFLSRRALVLAGLPDAALFVYADDMLHTLRLSRAGGQIGFFPSLRFEHDHRPPGAAQVPRWKLYYKYRNSLILYREAAGWLFWPVCAVVLPAWALRVAARPAGRGTALCLLARAVLHGLRGRTDVAHSQVRIWAREG